MKKSVRILLMIYFSVVLVFSAWKLWDIFGAYKESQDSYSDLEQYVSYSEPVKPTEPKVTTPTATVATEPKPPETTPGPDLSAYPQVDFVQLSQINPDIVAWIYIEDTYINYPVVQGTNNDYYLTHLFDETYNSSGCIFLDYRCASDFSGQNSVIYGHNMRDSRMFAGLVEYKDPAYFEEHPVVLLMTPTAYYKIQLFAGYVTDTWGNAWDLSFSDHDFASWLNNIQRRSLFKSEYAPTGEDRIVTLSTCTSDFESAKFILHGYIAEVVEVPTPAS